MAPNDPKSSPSQPPKEQIRKGEGIRSVPLSQPLPDPSPGRSGGGAPAPPTPTKGK
jgi:hypothetical protein